MEFELELLRILKETNKFAIGSIRQVIRENMDGAGNINGFVLLSSLNDLKRQLDIISRTEALKND